VPSFLEHCNESIRLFGQPWPQVHHWLDALAGTPEYGMRHRRKRHHEAGIREMVKILGEAAAPAARQHIISDLKQEGWKEGDRFPKDEQDYRSMGLF
jgi:hypothetical protein